MKILVSSEWLNDNINDQDLILLDASQKTKLVKVDHLQGNIQIKNARSFNLKEKFSDTTTSLPNMLPNSTEFKRESRILGINNSSVIVIYDDLGIFFSPRVWWMFKAMGHQKVYVLNGGLKDWLKKGFITEPKIPKSYSQGNFKACFNSNAVRSLDAIKRNIKRKDEILIDARSNNRFKGLAPEPRDIPSGSIKDSINIPYETVLKNGKYKRQEDLVQIFKNHNIDNRPLIFSCGSEITACIILLASELVLTNQKSVYDGSWTEWATDRME